MNDHLYMKMALALAERGKGFTSPNPMVGAVVVKNDRVVGKGWHQFAGGPHAEVYAIEDAGDAAKGATIYVTLEPCNHQGRTPPCTEKIIAAGISKVITAMEDPNPDVKGGGNAYLRTHGIETVNGVRQAEAMALNEIFIKYIQTKRPFVMLKCAATMDGRLATKTGDSKWVTGSESRRFVHRLRHLADGIMVGIGTVKADNPSLTTRLKNGTSGRDPVRIILDTTFSIDTNATVLNLKSDAETIIVVGQSLAEISSDSFIKKRELIENNGATVLPVAEKEGVIDLSALMEHLGRIGLTSLLIEGGGRVIASAFAAQVVDKVHFFYAPKILGGNDGIPICNGPGPELMQESISLKKTRVSRFGEDVMITGYI